MLGQTLLETTQHYWEDLFVDKSLVEDYIFKQRKFAFNNTFYAIDDLTWDNYFHRDFRMYPDHLKVTWYFGRPPQEIYKTAKKLIATCQDITPNYGQIVAIPTHLKREIANCVEEISQQAINGRTVDGLAYFMILENFL